MSRYPILLYGEKKTATRRPLLELMSEVLCYRLLLRPHPLGGHDHGLMDKDVCHCDDKLLYLPATKVHTTYPAFVVDCKFCCIMRRSLSLPMQPSSEPDHPLSQIWMQRGIIWSRFYQKGN